jgi:tetratricopeptide (TPR) repeat protein
MIESKVPSEDWLEQFKQATTLHTGGHLQAARLAYLKLVAVPPSSPPLLKLLGLLERDAGQTALAVRWLELAYKLQAECETALLLAHIHLQQDDYPRAKHWLQQALHCNRKHRSRCFSWAWPASARVSLRRLWSAFPRC